MRPTASRPLAAGGQPLRLILALALSLGFLTTARAQEQALHFVPFTLTVERANVLADLPLTPKQRAQLLDLIQQWSNQQDAAQQVADLQKQVATLTAKVADLQKPKDEKPAPKEDKKP